MLSYFGETRKECAEVFLTGNGEEEEAADVAPAAPRYFRVDGLYAEAGRETAS